MRPDDKGEVKDIARTKKIQIVGEEWLYGHIVSGDL